MSEVTLSPENPLFYNEDNGDTAIFVTANEYYNIDWGNQPQSVIGTVANLFKNGLEEYLIDRANKYMKITNKHRSFDKVNEISRRGENDWNIQFYGEDYRCGDHDCFYENIPLSVLLGDIDAQLENYRKEQEEKRIREEVRRKHEADIAAAQQEKKERETFERLKKKFEDK